MRKVLGFVGAVILVGVFLLAFRWHAHHSYEQVWPDIRAPQAPPPGADRDTQCEAAIPNNIPTLWGLTGPRASDIAGLVVSRHGTRAAFAVHLKVERPVLEDSRARIGTVVLEENAQVEWAQTGLTVVSPPTLSPNGSLVAFGTYARDANTHYIGIYDCTEEAVRLIARAQGDDLNLFPSWSPTDEWIAFIRGGNLWIVRPDGSEERQLTSEGDIISAGGEWSPEGDRIYFVRQGYRQERSGDAYAVDVGVPKQKPERLTRGIGMIGIISVSPDGKFLLGHVYSPAGREDGPGYEGTSVTWLDDPEHTGLLIGALGARSFSPDSRVIVGRRLRPTDSDTFDLWSSPMNSENHAIIARDIDALAWRNAWPVSDQIVFVRDDWESVWVVRPDGTGERKVFSLHDGLE